MKASKTQNSIILMVFIMIMGFSFNTRATENELLVKYWVFENNVNDKSHTVVKFYNSKDVMIYERKIEGKYLLPKKKDIKKLNKEMAKYNASTFQTKKKK